MIVKFKFKLDAEVTTSDGSEGKIASATFESGKNFYSVRILSEPDKCGDTRFSWQYLPERELIAGWNADQHTRKDALAG